VNLSQGHEVTSPPLLWPACRSGLMLPDGFERIGGFGGKSDLLNTYNTFMGDPDKFAADVERHRVTTADDIDSDL
jgi:zinc protease